MSISCQIRIRAFGILFGVCLDDQILPSEHPLKVTNIFIIKNDLQITFSYQIRIKAFWILFCVCLHDQILPSEHTWRVSWTRSVQSLGNSKFFGRAQCNQCCKSVVLHCGDVCLCACMSACVCLSACVSASAYVDG